MDQSSRREFRAAGLAQFWETKLTYQKSYLARLNYVHQNPVKHGLVVIAIRHRLLLRRLGWFLN